MADRRAPYDPMEGDIEWNGTGYGTGDPEPDGWFDTLGNLMPGIVGGIFTAGLGGGGGGASSGLSADVASTMAVPGTAGGGNMAGGGILGFFSKLKAAGIDPTTLGLGALSLFGGDDGQEMQSFKGTGADPVANMTAQLGALRNLTGQIAGRGPTKIRNYTPPAPLAVNVPGVPFQIGGGLERDPAIPPVENLAPLTNPYPEPKKAQPRNG